MFRLCVVVTEGKHVEGIHEACSVGSVFSLIVVPGEREGRMASRSDIPWTSCCLFSSGSVLFRAASM